MILPSLLTLFLVAASPSPPPSDAPVVAVSEIKEPVEVKVAVSDVMTAGGIVTILGAIGLLITTFFTAYTAYKNKGINESQNKKLDNVTLLVDGRYGEVLQELADVKALLADATGTKLDAFQADKAQAAAAAQHVRSAEAADKSGV